MSKRIIKSSQIIKILTIILPIMLFVFIAFSLYANILTNFESWAYSKSVEHMSPFFTFCMKTITYMGDNITITLICLALFAIPFLQKNYALPVSISVISSAYINTVLKLIFARSRPDILRLVTETDYSFPSGHSMASMALCGAFILLAWKIMKTLKAKIITTVICVFLIVSIGFSRIYLGVHYVTDVAAGWCLGVSIALCVVYVYEKIKNREK